ncbi:GGDEF domain-containing phosphodiesterase [Pelomonas sp. SE-A7]|uniref:putative bifunctional diguanylate cyclase/phosphodiesterase n=1 Tax=Pelomonas sp. SE-A7 TaxID=3054953 RepID=UPI00259CC982|nr:GGDEF domain-containing phosphodiesterase [Pelomonas sp. SE-A7]MDM4765952.1 EAL domain-containing protein [Pelomonas sp. SE-A7]
MDDLLPPPVEADLAGLPFWRRAASRAVGLPAGAGLGYLLVGSPILLQASPNYFLGGTGLALAALTWLGLRSLAPLLLAAFALALLQGYATEHALLIAVAELFGPTALALLFRPGASTKLRDSIAWLLLGGVLAALLTQTALLILHASQGGDGPALLRAAWPDLAGRVTATIALLLPLAWLARRARAGRYESSQWQELLDQSGGGCCEWNLSGTPSAVASTNWQRWVGEDRSWQVWLDKIHPLDRSSVQGQLQDLLHKPELQRVEATFRLRVLLGDWQDFRLQAQVLQRDGRGRAQRLLCLLHDVAWQRSSEERQRLSAHLFQQLHEGLAVVDPQWQLVDANPSYCHILRVEREQLLKRVALPLTSAVLLDSGHDPAAVRESLRSLGLWRGLVRLRRGDGDICALQLSLTTVDEASGPPRYHVLTVSDGRSQRRPDAQAGQDELTGLPNHRELLRLLDEAMQTSQREGFMLCVCCLDLDGFRQLNERHGQAGGDQLIHQVAQRLQGALRSAPQWRDLMARLDGDEFALILRCRSQDEAQRALERLLNVLRAPHVLPGSNAPLTLTASIGATLYPLDSSDGETLVRHATQALHRVKRHGRDAAEFFDTEKRARKEAQALALLRMQEALDAQELRLYYQPKVDMRRAKVLGMEALLRWQHPERGLLAPAHFLPVLEGTGLGVRIGDWVIEQALKQSAQWLAAGLRLDVSVNVSARHLQSPDFGQRLQELLGRHDPLVAHHLMLEVLESAALADVDATHALLQRCRRLGVRFALDDFGTGYANLTYLKRLPVDVLKIDRSFVQNMLADEQDRAIVEGVVKLARSFSCGVIAEGVESPAHAQALMKLGCDEGQGSGIASAMPAEEVAAWVQGFVRGGWPGPVRQPVTVD